MGLAQEVRELADTNKQLTNEYLRAKREAEKATKEAEQLAKKLELARQEKENQKEYERDLKKAVEKDIINTFSMCFESEGLEKGYINLRLKKTRDDIIRNVPENEFEARYLDENYERILEKVKKIYQNDFNAKQTLIQEETAKQLLKEMEEQEKEDKKNAILYILIKIFFIIFNPITIILYFLIWSYFYFAVPVLRG